MQDIQYQIFSRIYERCKYLLVPEFTDDPNTIDIAASPPQQLTPNPLLIAPRQFLTDAEIDDRFDAADRDTERAARNTAFKSHEAQVQALLPESHTTRQIVYLQAGTSDIDNLKDPQLFSLPALMIGVGADFVAGEELSTTQQTVTLGTKPKRIVVTLQLALTEIKDPAELYAADGLEVRLEQSRPGRALRIGGQLRQILDPTDFLSISQTFANYAQRSEVISSNLTIGQVLTNDATDTLIEYRYEVIFKEQVMRS